MTPFVSDPDFTLHVGDVTDVLATLPDESVHCVITSPPYWGLRDYGTGSWNGGNPDCDHKGAPAISDKSTLAGYTSEGIKLRTNTGSPFRDVCGKCGASRVDQQIGLEPTPEAYVARMVEVFREVRRVLRTDGTLWLNIGDSYNNYDGGSYANDSREPGQHASFHLSRRSREIAEQREPRPLSAGLKRKDLVGIPWRLAFALQADGWYLRADIIWSKPNPMPESVTDRPTKAHEYLFLLTKSARYFYDQDAIREPHQDKQGLERFNGSGGSTPAYKPAHQGWVDGGGFTMQPGARDYNPAGRNRRSVWEVATEPYPDAHFATYPQALIEPCIKAGTSEFGCCPKCGAPWTRETERTPMVVRESVKGADKQAQGLRTSTSGTVEQMPTSRTIGWLPTCECIPAGAKNCIPERPGDTHYVPVPCVVLDPFLGSGTTALVARKHSRHTIGIELNQTYAELAAKRLNQLSLLAEGAA